MYFLLKLLHLDLKVVMSSPCERKTIPVAPVFFQNMRRGPKSNKFRPIQHAHKEISFGIHLVKMQFFNNFIYLSDFTNKKYLKV